MDVARHTTETATAVPVPSLDTVLGAGVKFG